MKLWVAIRRVSTINYVLSIILLIVLAGEALAQGLGHVTAIQRTGSSLHLSVGPDLVIFKACTGNILQINYRPNGIEDPDTLVVMKTSWDLVSATIDTMAELLSITTSAYRVEIHRNPLRFQLYKIDRTGLSLICAEPSVGGIAQQSVTFNISTNNFYGIHNRSRGSLTTQTGGTITAGSQGQAGGPFAWTTQGWGFLADTDGGVITISGNSFSFTRQPDPQKRDIEFYFILGSPKEILKGLHEVTGFPPLFPKYSYGFMNTEWGIDQAELYRDMRTYREKQIPIDAYVLDFDWMDWGSDNFGEFRWGTKFPDGQSGAIVDTLRKYSFNLMGIRKPRIHLATSQGAFGQANNLFVDTQTDYFSGKLVGRLNFYNPITRQWYWESFAQRNQSYAKGITGYWNDEADEYGGNLMFMQMQRAQYEGQRAFNNTRVWSINRNFYTGAQRYAYGLWSGDIQTGFAAMADQRLFMLSSVSLGVSWWGMDVGGFQNTPTPENYYRWIQFGAFVPIFRVHGSLNQEREPWQYGAKAESIATKYIRLRYRLMPYIYSAAWNNHLTGLPLSRPLVIDYPDDPIVGNLASQWLFGDNLLVSPVTVPGATSQSVYLPDGEWYDFHSGKAFTGKAIYSVPVTDDDLPLFVKGGSIIPMSPPALSTDSPEMKRMVILSSYPNGTGECVVYDDDGRTYEYEKGNFSTAAITHVRTEVSATLSIAPKSGQYSSPERDWMAQFNWAAAEPDSVVLDGRLLRFFSMDSIQNQSMQGWSYHQRTQQCLVRFPDDKSSHLLRVYFSRTSSAQEHQQNDFPRHYALRQNYPNPFNPTTIIPFDLPKASLVSLRIYNALGQEIATLVNSPAAAGQHQVEWNATGPSGIYFCRLQAGDYSAARKLILIR